MKTNTVAALRHNPKATGVDPVMLWEISRPLTAERSQPFSSWLDKELAELTRRHQSFQTRESTLLSLSR